MNQQTITDYILQYRSVYTRKAITEQLINTGYNPAEVEEAWRMVGQMQATTMGLTTRPRLRSNPRYWVALLTFVIIIPLIIGIFTSFAYQASRRGGDMYGSGALTPMLFMIVAALILGAIITALMWKKDQFISRGILYGMILSVGLPFIPLAIIFGTCIVASGPT